MARQKRSHGGNGIIRALNLLAFLPLAGRAPHYGRLLLALATDPRVPASRKILLAAAAGYVISPVNLIPQRIPIIGAIDDVAVVVLAVDAFLVGLPSGLVGEKLDELGIPRAELEADLRHVRRMVPRPLREMAARVPDAIDGMALMVAQSGLDQRLRRIVLGRHAPEEVPA